MTGSLTWSIAAAAGLSAIMLANAWAFEALRYAGAAYLLFLAFKSARAALTAGAPALRHVATSTLRSARSEEHTSELQSLMRISYAVFCLKKKNNKIKN